MIKHIKHFKMKHFYYTYNMSLSNLSKEAITNLFEMLDITSNQQNAIDSIKGNYASYARLELISKQMLMLKNEAYHILKNHEMNLDFKSIKCTFKKVPGNHYYIYEKDGERFLSMIGPQEWNVMPGIYIKKVLFDYDYNFYVVE